VAISRRQGWWVLWVLWLGLQIPERTGWHGGKLTDNNQQNNGDVMTTIVTTEQLIGDSPFKSHYWAELRGIAVFCRLGLRSVTGLHWSPHGAETGLKHNNEHSQTREAGGLCLGIRIAS